VESRTIPAAWMGGAARFDESHQNRVTLAARVLNGCRPSTPIWEGIERRANRGSIRLRKSGQVHTVAVATQHGEQAYGEGSSNVNCSAFHRRLLRPNAQVQLQASQIKAPREARRNH